MTEQECVKILWADAAFAGGIESQLKFGISYPKATALAEFNISRNATDREKLDKVIALYNQLFKIETKIWKTE